MSDYILLTKDNVHEGSVSSLQDKEAFFSDGRSYVAELWDSRGIIMATYYFSAKGFGVKATPVQNDIIECDDDDNEMLLDYLIAEHKLKDNDPRMYIETMIYYIQGEVVFSVTVAVEDRSEKEMFVYREVEL